ncbi:peptidoglycan bridge formation glycyltransferase FemA/FemB family protein [Companilactobacillus sp. DQM5]|uniref:peptidoglycan bridge formation glycyltransferase FemA/FemB family protein n=1 Tax=Companilactobacillus sp. DQM5 TaxID=3463359 RepID=UPI004057E66A
MEFIDLSTRMNDWQEFVLNHPLGNFAQTINQFEVLKKRGNEVFILGVVNKNDKIIAGSVVTAQHVRLGKVFGFDHGPLLNYDDEELLRYYFNEVKKFAKKHGGLFLRVAPNVVYRDFDNEGNPISKANDKLLNNFKRIGFKHEKFQNGLAKSEKEARLKNTTYWQYVKEFDEESYKEVVKTYSKDVNYYLKKNKQFGIKLRQLPREDLNKFYDLTYDTGERLGIGTKSLEYYKYAFDAFKDKIQFLVAEMNFIDYISEENQKINQLNNKLEKINQKIEKYPNNDKFKRQFNEFDDQKKAHINRIKRARELQSESNGNTVIVAGGMFVKLPQEIVYLFSGTYEKYMEFYGPYQIQDKIIKETIDSGIHRYNFFGIDGSFDGSDGVLEFKKNFNGKAQQMVGVFESPINTFKYNTYKILKNLLKIIGR